MNARIALGAAVVLLGTGMAAVIAGILAPPFFTLGRYLLLIGLLAAAAAGVMALLPAARAEHAATRATANTARRGSKA